MFLSDLLLYFYDQQQYDCAKIGLCAANLFVCAVSEVCVHAHSLEGTLPFNHAKMNLGRVYYSLMKFKNNGN